MKIALLFFGLILVTSCSSEEKTDPASTVKPETSEKLKKAQDANVELEVIDGELDSLLTSLD